MDLDADFFMFMQKLRAEYIDNYNTTIVRGCIQYEAYNPLVFILFIEPQLKYLASQKEIFLNLDAAGSIAATQKYADRLLTIYYYVLWLRGGKGIAPLEIAEAHMAIHTKRAVSNFLKVFLDALKLLTMKEYRK